ncbi:hypothetical protein KR093_003943 [Drosophila rubida]|uniref:NADH dehydrogenase [ubiquinone] flavoprotein 3, mitochondrial n=1 Tax=Drosophila rubida TaxID=30044 RepID=A0AAD4K7R0_9MUSC|nr:hypothetical protein KR093_003943 [Drosophila rubida]
MLRTMRSVLGNAMPRCQDQQALRTGASRQYTEGKKPTCPCKVGPKPFHAHDPPPCYEPERLESVAFKIPPFIKAKIFRPMDRKEVLGPNAGKCECYKNPEYYAYHRYSVFDLKIAANAVKACMKCCE